MGHDSSDLEHGTRILERGLPSLGSGKTTSQAASQITSGSETTSQTSTASRTTSLPKLSSNVLSSSSSSSSTVSAPTITPPSSEGNPNIRTTNKPAGTVFIAVGSIVGAFFGALLLCYFISGYISRRKAQKQRYEAVERQFQSHASDTYEPYKEISNSDWEKTDFSGFNIPFHKKSTSHSLVALVDDKNASNNFSVENFASPAGQDLFSTIQNDSAALQNRRSLFISPTVEIVNQKRKSQLFADTNNSSTSLVSNLEPDVPLTRPERTVSPERQKRGHSRSKSSLGNLIATAQSSPTRRPLPDRKETPSMVLNKMFDDDES
ncbi:LAMI_0C08064g1_1 [Lachancea mirantina]|uniref:LAMI_0C08064g1_1 n=1 Tax=Lachancea mirantina TaxID=1230905 RepID=A0A1G4J498_9SACH|nr:LAMI_0C08064g1_1 [Lachancea mirantina]